jgi:hypothetical protein
MDFGIGSTTAGPQATATIFFHGQGACRASYAAQCTETSTRSFITGVCGVSNAGIMHVHGVKKLTTNPNNNG